MCQVVPNGGKSPLFISPVFGKVGLAAGGRSHAIKHGGRDWLQPRLLRADHVYRDASRLSEFGDILGRHDAGIVRTVGKHDDDFPALILRRILQREQQGVVECCFAGDEAAIYNTLLLTLKDATQYQSRKVVVVFSNGPDNSSVVPPEDVAEFAQS